MSGSTSGLTTTNSAWLDQVIVGLPDSAEDDDCLGRVLAVLEASRHTICLPLTLRQVPQPYRQFAHICERQYNIAHSSVFFCKVEEERSVSDA